MVSDWRILTIGNITRNRFWGEGDEKPLRSVLCTSTLIKTEDRWLLIDPAEEPDAMRLTLDRRAGIHPEDISAVFITHHHGDHCMGLSAFPGAKIFMPSDEAALSGLTGIAQACDGDEIAPGVRVVALPGHTDGLCGVVFNAAEGTVLVAGDAVMTRDFFAARVGYYNSVDFAACAQTHEKIAAIADVVVPGHDNYFLVKATK